jgi:photosystem II stability/assembly factor-like uncharacterized protein
MSLLGTVWTPIGPSPIDEGGAEDNGLVTAIAVNPNNTNVIYIGTAGGGVWRSADGGTNWTPLFDRELSLSIGEPGALAIDPQNTNVLFAGTSGRLIYRTFEGQETGTFKSAQAGLYKSTDGGASWILLGSGFPSGNVGTSANFANSSINVVIVDPTNSNVVYVASTNGVFVSTDGGLNFTQGIGASGDARSLVLDPTSPAAQRILYVGISTVGVFRSKDGGFNWSVVLSGATPSLATALCPTPPCIPPRGFGLFSVALAPPRSPPNPAGIQVIYAIMEGTPVNSPPLATDAPNPVGVFLSTDQGTTWTRRSTTGIPTTTYGGYCLSIAVDPVSPGDGSNDTVYIGDINQAVSTDSGNSFTGIFNIHSDTHAWAFIPRPAPATSSIVLCGTDGGIFSSGNLGGSWTSLNKGGLQTSLFYAIDLKPDATATVTVGALQDNSLETTSTGSLLGWKAGGADGFSVAYDTVPAQVFGSENGSTAPVILRSNNDGLTYASFTPWGTTSDQGLYAALVATDPSNPGTVYALGNQNLWQSTNSGGTWRTVLTGLTTNGNSVRVAPTNDNNVVVAIGNRVQVSTNARGAVPTFTDITRNLPTRNVARAVFDPVDPTVIYAVLGGLNSVASGNGHVFRTTIGATSWTDISPPCDIPFSSIAIDGSDTPPTIYVGTEFGVLRSVDIGATWYVLDDIHFPHVPVLELKLHNGQLRAGTYGRGVFAFSKPLGAAIALNLRHKLAFGAVCAGPDYLQIEIWNVGAQDLVINSVQRLVGSTSFSVSPTPSTPVVVSPGEDIEFTVVYTPTVPAGPETAIIRIASNDPVAPFVDVKTTGQLGTPTLVASIANGADFGPVCVGRFADEELTINNAGTCPLLISGIVASIADFAAPSVLSYPLVVSPGASTEVVLRFKPLSFGSKSAQITIFSNDPLSPKTFTVLGEAPPPRLSLLFADSADFGSVCLGSIADRSLTLIDSGLCPLTVTNITSSSPDFIAPTALAYPVTIGPGDALEVPIRFQPTSIGPHSATITVLSDDPAGPRTLTVTGSTPSGSLRVTGSLCFGAVKACRPVERTIAVCNVGECTLNVASVAFKRKSRHWRLINNPFPAPLHPGTCLSVVVRYRADEHFPRACELIITSDDPSHPVKALDVLATTIWERKCRECCEDCKRGCCNRVHEKCCCKECPPDFCDDDGHKDKEEDE